MSLTVTIDPKHSDHLLHASAELSTSEDEAVGEAYVYLDDMQLVELAEVGGRLQYLPHVVLHLKVDDLFESMFDLTEDDAKLDAWLQYLDDKVTELRAKLAADRDLSTLSGSL